MLKHVSICAALIVLATGLAKAQYLEAALHQAELPGAGFTFIVATPKSPATTINLGDTPDALVVPLTGGELALAFEDFGKMFDAVDDLQHPVGAFRVKSGDAKSIEPVSIYVIPNQPRGAATVSVAPKTVRGAPPPR
jgi:hypothetical protein